MVPQYQDQEAGVVKYYQGHKIRNGLVPVDTVDTVDTVDGVVQSI